MPRRAKVERRIPAPDARYNSEVLARFINKVMERGKKGVAESIVYGALDRIAERAGRNPLEVFEQALANATPVIEVKPRRVGGAKSMQEKLANELLDAFNNTGATIKRREDTHRMAEANRAFSHYGRF